MFFETLPNRFISIQNVIIGFISGFVCLVAAQVAGGVSDLFQFGKDDSVVAIADTNEVYDEFEDSSK